jgi:NADPH:quinone reductase-like Zn-dependent oxidoreductase|tara:strand:- start:3946 stop:4113 length:168 start_codon:yes stop_codon:yes gene_type:complete
MSAGVLGAYGIQIAKLLGAYVTAIAGNHQPEFLHSYGTDKVYNYNQFSISDFSDT